MNLLAPASVPVQPTGSAAPVA